MIMKLKNIIRILPISFMVMVGCSDDDGGEVTFTRSFITQCYFPDTLEVFCHELTFDTIPVALDLHGSYYVAEKVDHRYFEDWKRREWLFDSIVTHYADTTYNREIYIGGHKALATSIDSVSIISDADYDVSHKAGTDLSDLVVFDGVIFGGYVISHYSDAEYKNYYDGPDFKVKKPLSEFRPEDFHLWSKSPFLLDFPKPTLAQVHHVTFTFVTGGKRFEATAELDFND